MLSGVGALVVADLVDGHGEVLATGVLPPGDRGVDGVGERGEPGDLGLEVADRVAERVLVAQVGSFGALKPGQGGVGFGFIDEQRVAGGDGLDLAEGQGGVADVGDFAGVEAAVHHLADEAGLAFESSTCSRRRTVR